MIGQDSDSTRASAITLILAFIVSGLLLVSDRGSDRLMAQSKVGAETGFAPVLTVLSKPLRAVETMLLNLTERSRAVEENKALREELYTLREDKQRSLLKEAKLKRLEQILSARPGIDIPTEKIAARAVSEIDGPFVRSALINAGSKVGIKKGHPVMTVDGLYGHVLSVGRNSARVLRLGDLNSRISVMSARSDARAILSGNNSSTPLLAFVEDRADWRNGDTVLSSGDSGILPQGLAIGKVKRQENGTFAVSLHTANKIVDWVWVYPYVPIAVPDESEVSEPESDVSGVESSAQAQAQPDPQDQPGAP